MAKTINDFISDLQQDEALRESFGQAVNKDSNIADVIAFAAKEGYEFTEQDVKDLQKNLGDEVNEEELQNIAGGLDGGDALLCVFFLGIEVLVNEIFG